MSAFKGGDRSDPQIIGILDNFILFYNYVSDVFSDKLSNSRSNYRKAYIYVSLLLFPKKNHGANS